MEAFPKSRSPFNYRDAARSSRNDDSEGRSDEIGLRDIHVRNDFEVLIHEEDDGKSAIVGQNVVWEGKSAALFYTSKASKELRYFLEINIEAYIIALY